MSNNKKYKKITLETGRGSGVYKFRLKQFLIFHFSEIQSYCLEYLWIHLIHLPITSNTTAVPAALAVCISALLRDLSLAVSHKQKIMLLLFVP